MAFACGILIGLALAAVLDLLAVADARAESKLRRIARRRQRRRRESTLGPVVAGGERPTAAAPEGV